ncbi:MAG: hypothetical protein K2K19_10460, partial [Acetatifactor sp.]|nr:hypothetical protein [Acetatifactor sp.]
LEDCLQVFREDTWNWEQILLSDMEWIEGSYTGANRLAGVEEDGFLFDVTEFTTDEKKEYLGYYDRTETEILLPSPEGIESMSF